MHQMIFFTSFENLLQTIDNENKEILILGDLNCDLLNKPNPNHPTNKLRSLFEIYQLTQLIDEATRITETSSTYTY
jgi:exonuclease III